MKVTVLLATYNGEKYIRELLDSIYAQILPENVLLEIVASDDASTDNTCEIIRSEYPEVNLLSADRKGGAKNNFKYLIDHCPLDSELYFFADQDDVWCERKISVFFDCYKKSKVSSEKPLLLHSDLYVVDSTLHVISSSYFEYMKLSTGTCLGKSIIENNVTGCAMAVNLKMLMFAQNINFSDVRMHDWLFGILSKSVGERLFISGKTVLYRQHDNNCIGAKSESLFTMFNKLLNARKKIAECQRQAFQIKKLFLELGYSVPEEIDFIILLKRYALLSRIRYIYKYRILRTSKIASLIYLLFFLVA